ncbi:MAG: CapA family protein [Clostridia bacterium]|nr:CapA family protein [Clostridia bacterium]
MKIIIGGDVSIKDSKKLFEECKGNELFSDIVDIFKNSNRTIVNLECAVTDKDTPIKKIGPNLKAPLSTIKTLKDVGVTDVCLSNNHIFDYGKAGIKDTLELLEKYQINHTGFGKNEDDSRKNLIITDSGIKIAVIAVCEHEYSYALPNRMGARPYDPYDTNDDIDKAKMENDYVIVIYHGGKEECRYPSPRLLKACRSMVKHGADVVLCQHSHCIGCYEEYMGGHILYGQGNFHFVCKEYENPKDNGEMWNTGLLVEILIDKSLAIRFIPCVVDGLGIRLAKHEEAKRLLNELNERSKSLKDGAWEKHWREFALSQDRYKVIPDELKEEIAHFFDCESHTDAFKEINKTYNATNEID